MFSGFGTPRCHIGFLERALSASFLTLLGLSADRGAGITIVEGTYLRWKDSHLFVFLTPPPTCASLPYLCRYYNSALILPELRITSVNDRHFCDMVVENIWFHVDRHATALQKQEHLT